ncbi:MAG: hypothetical protein A3A86_00825 [Elusimicrobia bacterium RIFCSPLOWO2_01_FULL_60_11]|nr:MAG: hypothetical protein A3A86_00825 [Elusimicrobia bacterium RIFCSPLOWO2_01_FULL_60_11]
MTDLKRELGIFSCTMLVAGNMIGIGIFITAGRIYQTLPHPAFILSAWVLGGLLSLSGGLVYSELSTRFPRAGGGYVYIEQAFGPFLGFLAGFSSSMVTIPGTAAFLAIGVTKYAGLTDPLIAKTVAVAAILLISFVNDRGVLKGAWLQDSFMVLKLALIFGLIFAALTIGKGSLSNFTVTLPSPRPLIFALPLALIPIMYTYSGWDATVYVAGEVKDPSRTLPFSLFYGCLMVMLIYLALACIYIYALPVNAAPFVTPDNKSRIVTVASSALFGETAGKVIGALVAVSVMGCLSATILTGPRVIFAMARNGLLPKAAGEVSEAFATPSKAIWFHGIWACVLAVTGTFDQLLDYVTVPMIFFAAINGLSLLVLRGKNRSDPGTVPYRCFGYPILPVLFILGMGWIVINTAVQNPKDSLWGLVIVSGGIPAYFFLRR